MSCDNCGNPYATMTHEWTTEPPTEPGWYWVMRGHNQPTVSLVRTLDGKLTVRLFGDGCDSWLHTPQFTHWMRVDTPEPPK